MPAHHFSKRILVAMLGIAASSLLAPAANAAVYYLHDVTFGDGAAATGYVSTNVSGYVDGYDITTTAGALPGLVYVYGLINVTYNPGDAALTVFNPAPSYKGFLTLALASALDTTGATGNPLVAGSLECNDYACPNGTSRAVVTGFLSTTAAPEPAAWALMILGFGAVGMALRRFRFPEQRAAPA